MATNSQSQMTSSYSSTSNLQMNLLYRKKQIDYSKTIGYRSQGNSASKGIMGSTSNSSTSPMQ